MSTCIDTCSCVLSLWRLERYGTFTGDNAAAIPPLRRLIPCREWLTRNPASDNKLDKMLSVTAPARIAFIEFI
jgi:hypothetical protein